MAGARKSQPGIDPAAAARAVEIELDRLETADIDELRRLWAGRFGAPPPVALSKDLIARALAHAIQENAFGGMDHRLRRLLDGTGVAGSEPGRHVKVGSIIVREHEGVIHEVMVVPGGFCWQGKVYASLSTIAKRITGTSWNGPRFFGLRGKDKATGMEDAAAISASAEPAAAAARSMHLGGARRRSGARPKSAPNPLLGPFAKTEEASR